MLFSPLSLTSHDDLSKGCLNDEVLIFNSGTDVKVYSSITIDQFLYHFWNLVWHVAKLFTCSSSSFRVSEAVTLSTLASLSSFNDDLSEECIIWWSFDIQFRYDKVTTIQQKFMLRKHEIQLNVISLNYAAVFFFLFFVQCD